MHQTTAVKIWTPLLHKCVCFERTIKGFRLEVHCVFYYLSEKLPLSQKQHCTSEGAVFNKALYYYQQLSIAHYQVSYMLTIILNNFK